MFLNAEIHFPPQNDSNLFDTTSTPWFLVELSILDLQLQSLLFGLRCLAVSIVPGQSASQPASQPGKPALATLAITCDPLIAKWTFYPCMRFGGRNKSPQLERFRKGRRRRQRRSLLAYLEARCNLSCPCNGITTVTRLWHSGKRQMSVGWGCGADKLADNNCD